MHRAKRGVGGIFEGLDALWVRNIRDHRHNVGSIGRNALELGLGFLEVNLVDICQHDFHPQRRKVLPHGASNSRTSACDDSHIAGLQACKRTAGHCFYKWGGKKCVYDMHR